MRHSFNFKLFITIALVSLIYVISTPGYGQEHYPLADTTLIYRLDTQTDVFIDSTNELTIEQVAKPDLQQRFKATKSLAFGYASSTVWLRLRTQTQAPYTRWYLEIPAPYLEYVDFYQMHNTAVWHHSTAGYYRKQSEKDISHTGHVVPLAFDTKLQNTIFIRIAGKSPKTFPLLVLEKERFHQKIRVEDIGYGIFYGILVVMVFYNLLLYLTLKEINYLLYIFTIICTIVIFLSATGYGGKFIWPENPALNFYAGRMSMGVLTIFFTIFTVRFLEVKQYSKTVYYVLMALIPLGIIGNILVATNLVPSAG